MTNRQFRITSIELDKNERVTEITAVIRQDAYQTITSILGTVTGTQLSPQQAAIELSATDARRLLAECGAQTGHKGASDICGSLSRVLNSVGA